MNTLEFESQDAEFRPVITVVGASFAGCNVVNEMRQRGLDTFEFIKADKLPINSDEIRNSFDSNGTNFVIVVAGLGGNNAVRMATEVADIARERNIAVLAVATLPYNFEMPNKMRKALEAKEILESKFDTLVVIENENFTKRPDFNLPKGFKISDEAIIDAVLGLESFINYNGYINLDFNDLVTALKNNSSCYLCGESTDENSRVLSAFQNAIDNHPEFVDALMKSHKMLISLECSGQNEISVSEMGEITDVLNKFAGDDAWVKTGYRFDDTLGDKVRVRILVPGI